MALFAHCAPEDLGGCPSLGPVALMRTLEVVELEEHSFSFGVRSSVLAFLTLGRSIARSLRIELAPLRGPVLLEHGLHGSYGKDSMNLPTRLKQAFSFFHDSDVCTR